MPSSLDALRAPPPAVDEQEGYFTVRDATGQALAYMYFEKEPRRQIRRELLTRRGTANCRHFCQLPGLLGKPEA